MEDMIYSLFSRQVSGCPDAPAVADERRSLTYAELDRLADTILSEFPTRKPQRVGIVMNHGVEMIAALIAVLKSGAAYVPVEPTFPLERIRYILEETDADFVITHREYAELADGRRLLFIAPGMEAKPYPGTRVPEATAQSPAYILYTSGTTGKPKGVVVENRNVCHYARAFADEFHPGRGDVMMQYSICSFDIFVEEVFTTLLNGAALAIPSEDIKADMGRLMRFVEQQHVTIISGFPYLLLEMNKLKEIPSCLRLLISGGDVLRASYITNLINKVEIYNTYGPSETTVCATYFRCNDAKPLADGTYSIGRAVKGADVIILDEALHPVQAGETGEICILGDGVSHGYLSDTPESANFIRTTDGRRIYRSGDLGYILPDGNIAFLHRKDKQVMILGKRVECNEVENILCSCAEVECGAVCPYTDTQGLSYLVAYIVPQLDRFSLAGLKRKLSRYLTPFMIPEYFVSMPSLPLTPNGKIDRLALPVILKEGNL